MVPNSDAQAAADHIIGLKTSPDDNTQKIDGVINKAYEISTQQRDLKTANASEAKKVLRKIYETSQFASMRMDIMKKISEDDKLEAFFGDPNNALTLLVNGNNQLNTLVQNIMKKIENGEIIDINDEHQNIRKCFYELVLKQDNINVEEYDKQSIDISSANDKNIADLLGVSSVYHSKNEGKNIEDQESKFFERLLHYIPTEIFSRLLEAITNVKKNYLKETAIITTTNWSNKVSGFSAASFKDRVLDASVDIVDTVVDTAVCVTDNAVKTIHDVTTWKDRISTAEALSEKQSTRER